MKQKPHKLSLHALVPKAAFAVAGGVILTMLSSACRFDPQPDSPALSSTAGTASQTAQSVLSEPLPSLVLSDTGSSALPSQGPSSSSPAPASAASSKPPAVSPPASTVSSKPSAVSPPPSSAASKPPAVSSAPSSAVISSQSSSPKPASNAQDRVFDDAVFVGNSFLEDLYTYGGAGNADFYYRVGLTVRTVFTKPTAKGKVPVIDELNGKSYGKVLLMFGENELGWSSKNAFVQDYGKVIDAVRQHQPNAVIYIQSIFPVAKNNSENLDNARIREYNSQLKTLAAQKGVVYLDIAGSMQDANGNLPDGAAPDGIHFNRKYCTKWLDYLRQNL